MTPVEALKEELKETRESQVEYVTDSGMIENCYKYRYQLLLRREVFLKECIKIMEERALRLAEQPSDSV